MTAPTVPPSPTPRWVSWALGDLAVKLLVAALALVPYRVALTYIAPADTVHG